MGTLLITLLLVLPWIKKMKKANKKYKKFYLEQKEAGKSKLQILFKSKDFWMETILFLLIILPMICRVVPQQAQSVIELIWLFVFTSVVFIALFGILISIFHLWVYRAWDKVE
jgi:fatty-acid desaturase